MIKKVLLSLFPMLLVIGTAAYIYRTDIILLYVANQNQPTIGPNVVINWDQGPEKPMVGAGQRPPNIIFILADDLGINDISAYGGGVAGGAVSTPNIDRLAQEGASFTQAYAGNATCAPSRAMLMTGRYPTRTGFEFTPTPPGFGRMVAMIGNENNRGLPPIEYDSELAAAIPAFSNQGLPTEEVTVAEILQQHGYHTTHIGKWHLGSSGGSAPNNQGFDESLMMESVLYLPEDDVRVVNAKLEFDSIDRFLWARGRFSNSFNGGENFEPGGYLTDYWTDEALKVIDANVNRSFFLFLAHWGVHSPLQATKADYDAVGDIEPHRLRVYAAMIRALDRSVGRIISKLEEVGLTHNTLIVFTSDNGAAGYLGLPNLNAPYRGWKITLFEGGIRTPLFAKWPAKINGGTEINTPVAHIDVMPTLVEASGASVPERIAVDGRSFLAAAMDQGSLTRENDTLFWQSGYTRVVRADNWKLQVEGRRGKHWLFDLTNDPTEQHNLASSRPDKLSELKALLAAHHENSRGPLYPYTTESPIAIDKTGMDSIDPTDEFVYWPN